MAGARARPLPFDPVAEARGHWERAGWAEAAPGMAAVTSIMRAQQVLLARIEEVLRPHGLSFARYEVLMLLSFSRTGALPLARLGERLQVHPASVTNLVDRLTAAGLVSRVAHPSDRRATLVELTPDGRRIAESIAGARTTQAETIFAELSPTDRRHLVRILARLRD